MKEEAMSNTTTILPVWVLYVPKRGPVAVFTTEDAARKARAEQPGTYYEMFALREE